jgi:hypothetical protein|tara:strand:- start:18 stop:197 length:180 start_codon:yes stop_codon:yes gene_type:complete
MKPLLFESQSTTINLAIASEKLHSLMQEGKLNPADFHCLDPKSKKSVWGMLRSLAASVL